MNIALIGMMGCGKTTVGKLLEEKLKNYTFVDTDSEIVKKEKCTINEIFSLKGEEYFRRIENEILKSVLNGDNQIISTGGGIVIKDDNVKLLNEKAMVFYLKATPEVLFERVKNNNERPLLNTGNMFDKIKSILNKRACQYEKAHYIINTDNLLPENVVKEILRYVDEHC